MQYQRQYCRSNFYSKVSFIYPIERIGVLLAFDFMSACSFALSNKHLLVSKLILLHSYRILSTACISYAKLVEPVIARNALRSEVHHEDEKQSIDHHSKICRLGIGELEKAERFGKEN